MTTKTTKENTEWSCNGANLLVDELIGKQSTYERRLLGLDNDDANENSKKGMKLSKPLKF